MPSASASAAPDFFFRDKRLRWNHSLLDIASKLLCSLNSGTYEVIAAVNWQSHNESHDMSSSFGVVADVRTSSWAAMRVVLAASATPL
jgi:hypothetical protein